MIEKNIRADPQALQELIALGARATPAAVINGQVVLGFDRARYDELLGQ
ncbi:MAG: hypothetical protein IRZ14_15680 [Chloroflexi bacterium]|nr:hypothetical protein [Chloroflexota bacterium]